MDGEPLIDWITVGAQVINFLILVVVLKYLLYERIIAAMEEREHKIASRMEEADRKKQQATTELQTYQEKLNRLQQEKETLLEQAREEADQEKKQLLEKKRREIEEQQKRWYESLQLESQNFLQQLRQRLSQGAIKIARKTLADLADADLEDRIAELFLRRLAELDSSQWEKMQKSLRITGKALIVQSAFPLSSESQQALRARLKEAFSPLESVNFEVSPELTCGIRLTTRSYQILWEMEHYVEEVAEEIRQTLEGRSVRGLMVDGSIPRAISS